MPNSKPVAVIDIGSNSVRLVIYDGLKRAPMALFNEKVLCGLAKDITTTGQLNKVGVKQAHDAIGRFIKLSKIMSVYSLDLFATAAVRDASDGQQFVDTIKTKHQVDVTILSGDKEAEYAGLGTIASISNANGVVGDLGGGSLELIAVEKRQTSTPKSFPIGPLRLPGKLRNRKYMSDFIEKNIKEFPLEQSLSGKTFYAVGGAFRNLAKIHMGRKNYPLKVIHNYRVPAEDLLTTVQIVSRMSEASLLQIRGISRKRLGFLPYAALLLGKIIEDGKPKNIVFTTTGVREGFLFDKLSPEQRIKDPLISGCTDMMARILRQPEYGYELEKWMSPLFKDEIRRDRRLRLAACIMSEISCYENTEYRAELAYRKVLDSSLIGLGHKDRVFIAKSLYCRYSKYPDENILSIMQPLLSSQKIQNAQIIGSAMRLARSLSCSCSSLLEHTKLEIKRNKLYLTISKDNADLNGEAVIKRLQQLGEVMGMDTKVL